jgi:hypothetical protein
MKSAIGMDLFLMNNHKKENITNTYIVEKKKKYFNLATFLLTALLIIYLICLMKP